LLGLALLVPAARMARRAASAKVEVTYRGGPVVRAPVGPTLLEISRMHDVPHISVCGGRARCSTCRVGVESGLADLPAPTAAEAATLASIKAPPHVRLACQMRPNRPVTVTRLVAPPVAQRNPVRDAREMQGVERNLAVLFLDTRGFTQISEARLPYDVVFILNRLFAEVGEAIHRNHGVVDKYLGDGLMAVFGARDGEEAGCRQALRAASDVDVALDRLNHEIMDEIGRPLRIGMGIDVGPLVMGHIGHERSASVTVIGNTVNAASRLEALTKDHACQLIVAAEVLERAGLGADAFNCEDVSIRGLAAKRRVAILARARDLLYLTDQLDNHSVQQRDARRSAEHDVCGPRRPDAAGDPGPACAGRDDGQRVGQAIQDERAGCVEAPECAGAGRADRARTLGTMAAVPSRTRRAQRCRRLAG
jgi:adenylate cyclase